MISATPWPSYSSADNRPTTWLAIHSSESSYGRLNHKMMLGFHAHTTPESRMAVEQQSTASHKSLAPHLSQHSILETDHEPDGG
jgi:hypothetical protein